MITPDQLAKSGTEHGEQVALFAFLAVAHIHGFELAWKFAEHGPKALPPALVRDDEPRAVPALEWIHAIPNGGSRGDDEKSRAKRGGEMKAEGVRTGIADIFLPYPKRDMRGLILWAGLYIEMKKSSLKPKREGSKGGLSDEQISFAEYAKNNGYGWIVCYTWREAAQAIERYINWQTPGQRNANQTD